MHSSLSLSKFSTPFTVGVLMRTPEALLEETVAKVGFPRSSSSLACSCGWKSTLDFLVTMRSEREDTLFMRTCVLGRDAGGCGGGGKDGVGVSGGGGVEGQGEGGDSDGSALGSINRPGGRTSEEGLRV